VRITSLRVALRDTVGGGIARVGNNRLKLVVALIDEKGVVVGRKRRIVTIGVVRCRMDV